jgi:primosomal protein N'
VGPAFRSSVSGVVARMAMYKDLDTRQQSFSQSDIVQALLAGSGATSSSPFADEYQMDLPEIEGKVPCVVMEADSSQFSTLVDVAEGKDVAVEGPPGTGKSQTIVNAIASALADGKKVLFVAEKLAALNVVKSRLEAFGLGEFLLPLQAERSTREQVVSSIRDRLEMRERRAVRDYDEKVRRFRRVTEIRLPSISHW